MAANSSSADFIWLLHLAGVGLDRLDLLQIRFSGGCAPTKPNPKTLICKKSIVDFLLIFLKGALSAPFKKISNTFETQPIWLLSVEIYLHNHLSI